jgi:D-methionine transport system substrate-binding protein
VCAQEKIKVGVTVGPHAQIIEQVKKVAAKDGLQIEVIEFSDFVQPNAALAAGELDANSYQHLPYLEAQVRGLGYPLVNVGYTVSIPMGIYSKRVDALTKLRQEAKIAIPNDPTNGARALFLLQREGLIGLRDDADLQTTTLDIVRNPKKLHLIELDAAQIPRVMNDADAVVVNTDFALQAGLKPRLRCDAGDALALERRDGPYANLIAVRANDRNKPWVAKLVRAYHAPQIKRFLHDTFKGAVVPAW